MTTIIFIHIIIIRQQLWARLNLWLFPGVFQLGMTIKGQRATETEGLFFVNQKENESSALLWGLSTCSTAHLGIHFKVKRSRLLVIAAHQEEKLRKYLHYSI